MKTSVLRYRDRPASIWTLEPSVQKGIRELGMTAATLLAEQNPALWTKAADTELLKRIIRGASYLGRIGCQNGPDILVQDSASHHAFVACLFLASQASRLCLQCRADLRMTVLILAESCPVDLPITTLPPLTELAYGLRNQSIMRKHYPAMRKSGGNYQVTLADALRLLIAMERAPSVKLLAVMMDLRRTTEGLRTALRQTGTEKP